MRTVTRAALGVVVGLAIAGLVVGCGKTGSSGTKPTPQVKGAGCAPVAGKQLVLLADDRKLQSVDNVIPAINAKAAGESLVAALDKVSTTVGLPELAALNKATDVDRKTSKAAAEDFAAAAKLTDGISTGKGSGGKIIIGTATFSESQTLGELYRIALQAAGYDATVLQIGGREVYEPELEKGEIQVVPEYAGSLTEFLNKKVNGSAATTQASGDLDKTVTALKGLGSKVGITFGKPSQAANENAFGVTKTFADKYGIASLSDFAAKCSGRASVLGGPAECPQRAFCQQGLQQMYGIQFGRFTSLDAGGPQTKAALTNGTISIGLVFSSDSAFAAG
jgi:osmoprotectant transport system substrate-binding protein